MNQQRHRQILRRVDYAQQSLRLGQATEMLRLIHNSACPLKDSLAFAEHTTITINRHLDATAEQALPVEKSASPNIGSH